MDRINLYLICRDHVLDVSTEKFIGQYENLIIQFEDSKFRKIHIRHVLFIHEGV